MRHAARDFIASTFSFVVFTAITLAIASTTYQVLKPDGGLISWIVRTWEFNPALLVTLGGNDMLRGIDPATSRANLETILQGITARGLPFLLVSMQAPGNYGPDYKAEFDAIYPELAAKYGPLPAPAFFGPLLDGSDDPAAVQQWMQADGIHPDAEGVTKIVAGLGPQVLTLLALAGK